MEGSSKSRERGVTGLWPRRLAIDLAWGRNSRSERWWYESLESGDPKGKLPRMRSKTKVEHGTQWGLFLDLLNLGPFQISVWWHVTKEQRREVWSGGKDSGVWTRSQPRAGGHSSAGRAVAPKAQGKIQGQAQHMSKEHWMCVWSHITLEEHCPVEYNTSPHIQLSICCSVTQ